MIHGTRKFCSVAQWQRPRLQPLNASVIYRSHSSRSGKLGAMHDAGHGRYGPTVVLVTGPQSLDQPRMPSLSTLSLHTHPEPHQNLTEQLFPEMPRTVKVAAVQASPIAYDLSASLDKVSRLVAEASSAGAQLVVLPEAFLSAYPRHSGFAIGARTEEQREWFARYVRVSRSCLPSRCRLRMTDLVDSPL